MQWRTQAIRLD